MRFFTRRTRFRRQLASLVALTSVVLTVAALPASPAQAGNGGPSLLNAGESQPYCLSVDDPVYYPYLYLTKDCSRGWLIYRYADGTFAIGLAGVPGGGCVDVANNNAQTGMHLWLWPCNGSMAQRWRSNFATPGWRYIEHVSSGLRLEERYGGTDWGWVSLGQHYGNWNQVWYHDQLY
ncbi:RICIN domain-containing protein [Micromonospora echinofusca]|uniref:Ricin B lectin domain-containing protein n=1 Tax=Micromonospora echinofusca TaxID=47858 RepID=A0ABS3VLE8_MICEH|nr:hypothetical protein [Micromonospora echinofusca]